MVARITAGAAERIRERNDSRSLARAFCAGAFVHLALGDEDALKDDV